MPSTRTIVFDIETGPLPLAELVIPPFVASEVKLGNIKNPDLIAEKIQRAEETHVSDYIRSAALSAMSGQVLCIGYSIGNEEPQVLCADTDGEAAMLQQFWSLINTEDRQPNLLGFNIKRFDLPFLVRRSWKHKVQVPYWLRNGRYWSELIVDIREVWQLGDSQAQGSLGAITQFLGLGGKSGDGAKFSELWQSDRPAAIAYCLKDVSLTRDVMRFLVPAYLATDY